MIKLNIETYKPTTRQALFHSSAAREVLYGGAKGGGKSVALCWEAFRLSHKYKGNKIWMGRKRAVDFNKTTLETFKREINPALYTISEQKKEIKWRGDAFGGSRINYGGMDAREDVESFNSAEYGAILIDQAEEISRQEFGMAKGTLRWKLPNGVKPDYKVCLTANPAQCWLKDYFILSPEAGTEFIKALPSDNPHLPVEYIKTLEDAFKFRPELLQAYLYGNWDALDSANIVIKMEWIEKAVNNPLSTLLEKRKVVACDPARFGDDETVIYVMAGNKIIDSKIYGQRDTMNTCGEIVMMMTKHNIKQAVVDEIGIGAGIGDRLREMGKEVISINSANKSSYPDKFANLRAEIWWYVAERFARREVAVPPDQVLKGQLNSMTYDISSTGVIKITPKSEIKDLMNKSPDRADCFAYALYGTSLANVYEDDVILSSSRVNDRTKKILSGGSKRTGW